MKATPPPAGPGASRSSAHGARSLWKGLRAVVIFVLVFIAVRELAMVLGASDQASDWAALLIGVLWAVLFVWQAHKRAGTGVHAAPRAGQEGAGPALGQATDGGER